METALSSTEPHVRYLGHLRDLLHRFYVVIREYGLIGREQQTFIQGYMAAGRVQGIVSRDALKQVMEEENRAVFGVSIEEKRKTVPVKTVSIHEDAYLDIPTVVRGPLKLV